jgi:hypothetical protein
MNFDYLRLFHILRPVAGHILRFDGNAFVNVMPAIDHLSDVGGITAILTGTTAWNPPSLGDAADTSTSLTVTGAAPGDPCLCGFSGALDSAGGTLPGVWELSCNVSAVDTIKANLTNQTGSTINLGDGTLRCTVFKY